MIMTFFSCWGKLFRHKSCSGKQMIFFLAAFREVLLLNTPQGKVPHFTGETSRKLDLTFKKDIQEEFKNSERKAGLDKQINHAKSLTVQGSFLALAPQEQQEVFNVQPQFYNS